MFWGRPSQCIYKMVQGFLTHGILLCMVFIFGFLPIIIFRVFWSYLERVGINHNKCSTSLHLGGSNNNDLDHIWWIFSCEGQNRGNNGGNMMNDYGLGHGELGEYFLVLSKGIFNKIIRDILLALREAVIDQILDLIRRRKPNNHYQETSIVEPSVNESTKDPFEEQVHNHCLIDNHSSQCLNNPSFDSASDHVIEENDEDNQEASDDQYVIKNQINYRPIEGQSHGISLVVIQHDQ